MRELVSPSPFHGFSSAIRQHHISVDDGVKPKPFLHSPDHIIKVTPHTGGLAVIISHFEYVLDSVGEYLVIVVRWNAEPRLLLKSQGPI